MRRAIISLIASTGVLLGVGVAVPLTASAQVFNVNPFVIQANSQFICDGQGQGSCKSLKSGAKITSNEKVYAIGLNSGAWKWDVFNDGTVTSSTFTDGFIDNALAGQPILVIQLHDQSAGTMCNGNDAGGDVIQFCDFSASQLWVADPSTDTLVNIGRSNDKDNWEVLCNPGGGGQLIITTRDACTTYHEQWGSLTPA